MRRFHLDLRGCCIDAGEILSACANVVGLLAANVSGAAVAQK
jgi:hypothetical protein